VSSTQKSRRDTQVYIFLFYFLFAAHQRLMHKLNLETERQGKIRRPGLAIRARQAPDTGFTILLLPLCLEQ
jgi:hypothetical protein